MKHYNKIEEKFGHNSGFTVPQDFFDTIYNKVSSEKGDYHVAQPQLKKSIWNRMQPYIYLAAMFAGIWCMMKVVTMINTQPDSQLNNIPEQIACAMQDDDFFNEYNLSQEIDNTSRIDYELESELEKEYTDFSEFVKQFNTL